MIRNIILVVVMVASLLFVPCVYAETKILYIGLEGAEAISPDKTTDIGDYKIPLHSWGSATDYIVATTEEEAKHAAMDKAKEHFPSKYGWYNHSVKLLVVPQEVIDSLKQ